MSRVTLSTLLLAVLSATPLRAQSPGSSDQPPPAIPAQAPAAGLRRWLDLQLASIAARYRIIESSAGITTTNQMQYREQVRASLKLDSKAHYAIQAGLFCGSTFSSGWNLTGVGTGDPTGALYLKQLFASAAPVRGLELQVGGLYVVRGESTEITSYDDDAYIVGERVRISRADMLWFDEASATQAYVGDLSTPNVLRRLDRLGEPNYRQLDVVKRTRAGVNASLDFTTLAGERTLRAAAAVHRRPVLKLDLIRFEAYRRVTSRPAGGFAVTIERVLTGSLRVGGGYATIDAQYGGLNADRFNRGRRVFATSALALTPSLTLTGFITRAVSNNFAVANRTRADVILTYNALPALRRTRLF